MGEAFRMNFSFKYNNDAISPFTWGITLACAEDKNYSINRLKTQIIFEGVSEEGNYFYQIAQLKYIKPSHLNGFYVKGAYCVKFCAQQNLNESEKECCKIFQKEFSGKSQTWIVKKEVAQDLIDQIIDEAIYPIPYSMFGNKSFFSSKVETIDIYHEELNDLKLHNPELFLRLFDSAQNKGHPTGFTREQFDDKIYTFSAYCLKEHTYPDLIKKINHFSHSNTQKCNNSFTWARSKLERAGIFLDDQFVDNVISLSSIHVNQSVFLMLEPQKIELENNIVYRPLKGRFTTFDIDRDKRSEKKKIDDYFQRNKEIAIYAAVLTGTVFVSEISKRLDGRYFNRENSLILAGVTALSAWFQEYFKSNPLPT